MSYEYHIARSGSELVAIAAQVIAGTRQPRPIGLIPGRDYVLSNDTLFLGKPSGGTYAQCLGVTIETIGLPIPYYDDAPSNTARIISTFTDRPIIAIQCGRECIIRNVKIAGPTAANFVSNPTTAWYQAGEGTNFEERTTTEAWYTPDAGIRTNRYSPFCAIAIDPYGSAVASENRYPGQSARYVSDAASSSLTIENVVVQHVHAGIVGGLGVTGNTSEMNFKNIKVHGCKYGVALCHAQAKNWHFDGLLFLGVWGVVVPGVFGAQTGPLPNITRLRGSQANYLFGTSSGAGGPWCVDLGSATIESIMRISPAPLGGAIGQASAGQLSSGVIRNGTINWAGGASNTTPQIHAQCTPLEFDNVQFFPGGSTKKTIVSTSTMDYDDNEANANLYGFGVEFNKCNFRMLDAAAVANIAAAIVVPSGHDNRWIESHNSWVSGATDGVSNTRVLKLPSRGL